MPYPPPGPAAFQLQTPSAATLPTDGEAAKLVSTTDGKVRFELDAQGRWKSASAIAQGVALSMAIQLGEIPSAPEVGNELGQVTLGQANTAAAVIDAVNRAYPLREYLAQGLVQTVEIRHEEGPHGRLLVEYVFREVGTDRNQSAFNRP